MRTKFVAQIEASNFENEIEFEIISKYPEVVLSVLEKQGYVVPSVAELLNHLFVNRTEYCKSPYTILVRS